MIRGLRLFLAFFLFSFSVMVFSASASGESSISSFFGDQGQDISNSTQSSGLAPPASDLSVVFLGNLFGLVDGVLHGSGSQIMGVIFNVFNSAVLALGGIVMMYIIIVSTMNTAHEGQMLGQKWSSIWVPVRATMGLALLIPKSSGYCLMQIFVMWVVVQGVGIADKVWGTALDYLNRGGVIMQAQIDPTISRRAGITDDSKDNSVIDGASTILYGQVCMLALQTQLENQRKLDLEAKKEDTGPCAGQPPALMQQYCDNSVPDFIGSVDPLAEYTKNSKTPSIEMPNVDTAPYNKLNGICGTLKWNSFDVSALWNEASSGDSGNGEGGNDAPFSRGFRFPGNGKGGNDAPIPRGFRFPGNGKGGNKAPFPRGFGAQNEEEEESIREQAEIISRAMQASSADLDAVGSLQARATTPDSPVGKQYAKFSFKGSARSLDKVDKAVGGVVGVDDGLVQTGAKKGADYATDRAVDDLRAADQAVTGGKVEEYGTERYNKAKNTANTVKDGTVNTANTVKDGTVNTANTVKDGTVNTANAVENVTKVFNKRSKSKNSFGGGGGGGGGMGYSVRGGRVRWKTDSSIPTTQKITLSPGDLNIIKKSRAAAIAQMYLTLSSTARAIVSNDPQITPNTGNPENYASDVADYQFGVPQTSLNGKCLTIADDCPYWGKVDDSVDNRASSAPVLLDGTELQDAVTDYHAVMQPALKLLGDVKKQNQEDAGRGFIQEAKRSGWVLAGSYFFHLIKLNGSAIATSDNVDTNSGLGKSSFSLKGLAGVCEQKSDYHELCTLFSDSENKTNQIMALFTGSSGENVSEVDLSANDLERIPNEETITSPEAASTVFGYANNAMLIDLPGQSGLKPKGIGIRLDKMKLNVKAEHVGDLAIPCGFNLFGAKCVGRKIADTLWKGLAKPMINGLIDALNASSNYLVNKILILPLEHFMTIFKESMKIITTPGTNPVLALALMGVKYINMSMDTWMGMVIVMLSVGWIPGVGAFVMMILPLFMVWMGIMVGIGFTTAYYIPFLPYMIFTFGAVAWFISVVEAMAAAPLVALGISHPEGHDAMGKSEQGLMILLNVFLRPAMMVIGFIAAIAMCYVGVWLLNSGFSTVLDYLQSSDVWGATDSWSVSSTTIPWSNLFGFFFVIVIYTMLYLTLVEKSFSLIAVLPDKVLRWVGGQQENVGEQASQWTQDTKGKIDKAGDAMDKSMGAIQKSAARNAAEGAEEVRKGVVGRIFPGRFTGGGS